MNLIVITSIFCYNFLFVESQVPPTIINSTLNDGVNHIQPQFIFNQSVCAMGSGGPNNQLTFIWTKNDQSFTEGISIGNIHDMIVCSKLEKRFQQNDEGLYKCIIFNNYGKVITSEADFKMSVLPYVVQGGVKKTNKFDYLELKCNQLDQNIVPPIINKHVVWVQETFNPPKVTDIPVDNTGKYLVDSKGNLHISLVELEDDFKTKGSYKCLAINELQSTTRITIGAYNLSVIDVSVELPPFTISTSYSNPEIGLLGENVELVCFFKGSKDHTVTWLKPNNDPVTGDKNFRVIGQKLLITDLEERFAGIYTCIGKTAKQTVTSKINLTIGAKPTFKSYMDRPYNRNVTVGADTYFTCNPEAIPEATIEWMINGDPLKKKARYSIDSNNRRLTIEKVEKVNDVCVIQCKVSNMHGRSIFNGYLNVLDPTKIQYNIPNVDYKPDSNATFDCHATTDKDTFVRYNWLLNGVSMNDGSIKTDENILFLDLANLPNNGRKYIGKWTCVANNSYSWDTKTAELIDRTPSYVWPYWWIVLLIIVIFLLLLCLICLICCCLYQNRGDQYPVDEVEHKNGNDPEKELIASGFHDYQRDFSGSTGTLSSQDRTINRQKRSQGSLGGSQSKLNDESAYSNA